VTPVQCTTPSVRLYAICRYVVPGVRWLPSSLLFQTSADKSTYTVNQKKNTKIFLSYLLRNEADSGKVWYVFFLIKFAIK